MSEVINLRGYINNVKYQAFLAETSLPTYKLSDFDANVADGRGIIDL